MIFQRQPRLCYQIPHIIEIQCNIDVVGIVEDAAIATMGRDAMQSWNDVDVGWRSDGRKRWRHNISKRLYRM